MGIRPTLCQRNDKCLSRRRRWQLFVENIYFRIILYKIIIQTDEDMKMVNFCGHRHRPLHFFVFLTLFICVGLLETVA